MNFAAGFFCTQTGQSVRDRGDYQAMLPKHGIAYSMSRKGHRWDIEVFYNRQRRYSHLGHMAPLAFEDAAVSGSLVVR